MIKFFKKIRNSHFGKSDLRNYFKYALREITIIVIGILIALSINNWNESRKNENKKQELIINLIDDFKENREDLEMYVQFNSILDKKMNAFLENAYVSDIQIPLDSLKNLSTGFFEQFIFTPFMASYDEAKSNGTLSLIKNKKLSREFNSFQAYYGSYKANQHQIMSSYSNGSVWELTKSVGSRDVIFGYGEKNTINELNYDSYKKFINKPIFTAAIENQFKLKSRNHEYLLDMKITSSNIIKILTKMKKK